MIIKKSTLLMFQTFFICSIAIAQNSITVKNYNDSQAQTWRLPAAYVGEQIIDFTQFPNPNYNFTISYGTPFVVEAPGKLNGFRFYLERIQAERTDSIVMNYDQNSESGWILNQRLSETEIVEKFAQRIQAPYVGVLKSVSLPAQKVYSGDGFNDSLIVRFHPSQLSVTSSESYFNSGIVWFFGLPRTTNNVQQYGVRFTAPGESGSVKLQGVEFYIFSINDTRFYSGYDTPADDSLIVRVYGLDANYLPSEVLAKQVYPFSELSAGFDNRFDFSDFNLQFEAGTDFVIATEVVRVNAQDYIGFVSGNSFTTPINRTIMFENDGWIYLSNSASWGGSGAKGAEIRATAIYEDPNNGTPDSNTELVPHAAISFSAIPDNGLATFVLREPLQLFEGEEVWISIEQRTRSFRDSVRIFTDTLNQAIPNQASAIFGRVNGERYWYFSSNSPSLHRNFNVKLEASFSAVLNDRAVVEVFDFTNKQVGNFITSTSVPLNQLVENEWNEFSFLEQNRDVESGDTLFAAISLFRLQDSDGLVVRTDSGDASRTEPLTFVEQSKVDGWLALDEANFPALWAEMLIKINPTSLDELATELPQNTQLIGAYPNPFNPSTTIRYQLSQNLPVNIFIYDVMGRLVKSADLGQQSVGEQQFLFDATGLASGLYLYQVIIGVERFNGKLTLIK